MCGEWFCHAFRSQRGAGVLCSCVALGHLVNGKPSYRLGGGTARVASGWYVGEMDDIPD